MASIKISELDNVTTLVDSDALPIVNGNTTKKVTINKLGDILATKDYVTEQISSLGDMGFTPIVVTSLPTSNIKTNTIYLKLSSDGSGQNIYDEWMYINNKWEQIGSTKIDLSDIPTQSDLDAITNLTPFEVFDTTSSISGYSLSSTIKTALTNFVATWTNPEIDSKRPILIGFGRYNSGGQNYLKALFNQSTRMSASSSAGKYYTYFALVPEMMYNQSSWDGSLSLLTLDMTISGTSTLKNVTISSLSLSYAKKSTVLTKTNTSSYTPSANYHPATKKYVDDSIAAAITTTLESEY